MRKNVILLNGPPGSGKDTIADLIVSSHKAEHLRFKTKLYEITALLNNIDLETFIKYATDRETKESLVLDRGLTPRALLIEASENVIKPYYGEDYFGIVVGETIRDSYSDLFVISDGGFVDELIALIDAAELTGDDINITVIKLFRDGCTFDNDSREYLPEEVLSKYGITALYVYNKVTIEELEKYVNMLCSYIKTAA